MKKTSILLAAIIVFAAVANTFALKIPSTTKLAKEDKSAQPAAASSSEDLAAKIQKVYAKSENTTELYKKSMNKLNSVLSTQEQMDAIAASSKKNASAAAANNLAAIAEQEGLKAAINAMSAVQKAQMVDAGYNVVLSNLKFVDLAKESKELLNLASQNKQASVKSAGDIKKLNTVVKNTTEQLESAKIANAAIFKILKTGGVKFPAPVSADVAPKNIE